MVAEEYTTEVQGLPTRYLTAGTTGPPLVLLHGVGANAFDWQWVMPALAGTHHVYAPDLPGSGGSVKPLTDYSPAFFTSFVVAFLDTLGVDRAAVVGNSMGGLVGLRLALGEPERVRALAWFRAAAWGGRSPTPCELCRCQATVSWRSPGAGDAPGRPRGL